MDDRKLDEIDYRALDYLDDSWSKSVRIVFGIHPYIFLTIIIIISLVGLYYLKGMTIYLLFPVIMYVSYKIAAHKNKIWRDFAASNNWYITPSKSSDPRLVPPGIYGIGERASIGDIIHAQFEGHECDVFMYQFTTGSGKHKTTHFYTVARVLIDRPFPHIIIDSKKSRALKHRGEATDSAALEGNFSDYFSVCFNKGDHVNALSIITPDIMQTLIDSNVNQDIEIIDNNIFFMMHSDQRNADNMSKLFDAVDVLVDEIKHKAKTIHYRPEISQQERILALISSQSFQSGSMVMHSLWWTVLIVISFPFILILIVGMFMSLLGGQPSK